MDQIHFIEIHFVDKDISQIGHFVDKDISQIGHFVDKDISQIGHFVDKDISQIGHFVDKDISQAMSPFQRVREKIILLFKKKNCISFGERRAISLNQ